MNKKLFQSLWLLSQVFRSLILIQQNLVCNICHILFLMKILFLTKSSEILNRRCFFARWNRVRETKNYLESSYSLLPRASMVIFLKKNPAIVKIPLIEPNSKRNLLSFFKPSPPSFPKQRYLIWDRSLNI